jgi:hypothetical protein
MIHEIQEHPDNDIILSEMLAQEIIEKRKERYPSAEDLVSLPVRKVIIK